MDNMANDQTGIDRRGFLKMLGAAGAGAALAAVGGCGAKSPLAVKGEVPTDKMTYRRNPRNGDKISLLAYGMMRLPRVPRARKESLADTNDLDQDVINELVDYAIAHGVNYFDTSPRYCQGFSERATGIALSRHPRDKYFIATKMSNQTAKSREESLDMYRKSFEELRVDYFDYYLLHSVSSRDNFKERYIDNGILDFLLKEREAGRIRNLGWSFHGEGDLFGYLMSEYKWDFTMIQVNYFDWRISAGTNRSDMSARRQYEILAEKNVPAVIMEPLLGGGLAMPHYKARAKMVQADPNASAASWAFRFAGSLPNVLTVLSGMTFMDHLQDNIRTYSPLVPLSEKDNAMLDEVAKVMLEYRNLTCTQCQYCMPCPYGLDIPEIFAHFNRSLNEGNFPDDKLDPDYKRARRAFLVGLDRSVSPIRQANRCTGCGICQKACPQRIDIPAQMQRIDKFIESMKV